MAENDTDKRQPKSCRIKYGLVTEVKCGSVIIAIAAYKTRSAKNRLWVSAPLGFAAHAYLVECNCAHYGSSPVKISLSLGALRPIGRAAAQANFTGVRTSVASSLK
jgi:hypothetical protein